MGLKVEFAKAPGKKGPFREVGKRAEIDHANYVLSKNSVNVI